MPIILAFALLAATAAGLAYACEHEKPYVALLAAVAGTAAPWPLILA